MPPNVNVNDMWYMIWCIKSHKNWGDNKFLGFVKRLELCIAI